MDLLLRPLSREARKWTRRLLVALACLQVVSPAAAAVADAWRMDARVPYAHVEEQGATGCAMVHDSDCLLCAIATNDHARPTGSMPLPAALAVVAAPESALAVPAPQPRRLNVSSRAPPVLVG